MPDYKLKSDILYNYSKELVLYSKCSKIINLYPREDCCITYEQYINALRIRQLLYKRLGSKVIKEFGRLNNSNVHRVIRLSKRISKMLLNSKCLFLTLTFTDESLAKTSAKYRRLAVSRFLRQFNVPYVGNLDFGKKNGREHYHAILATDKIDYHLWKFGSINGLKIRSDIQYNADGEVTDISVKKLSKYVAKLTNHAIKETTKRSVLIYSREKFDYLNGEWQDIKGKIKND